MRDIAQKYANSYLVTIFACAREILLLSQHSGGVSLDQFLEMLKEEKQNIDDLHRKR